MTLKSIAVALVTLWTAVFGWILEVSKPEAPPLESPPTESPHPDASDGDGGAPAAIDASLPNTQREDAGEPAGDPPGDGVDAAVAQVDAEAAAPVTRPTHVDITWMSISNMYYELGSTGILTDGYITRIPLRNFFGGSGGLASTREPNTSDIAAVTQVLTALGGPSKVDLLLTGHSHFDHAFDTAAWSTLTGAPIIGAKTTCFQVIAQSIPAERCTPVVGGERIALSDSITMRVVRWNHSGSATSNPEQHNAVELDTVPVPDAVTGGLRAGVAEDFPNGGGGRAFLFTVEGADGPFSWFFQNSASASDLHLPIVVDGVDYGAPIENLRAALADAGLTSVDLWIGTGGSSIARLVLPILNPRAYLPIHWDGLDGAFLAGVPRRYSDTALANLLAASGVKLLQPVQYMDKWRLDPHGVVAIPNSEVKQALGFAP